MSASFERGSEQSPRGHAILYYTASMAPDEVWATYLIILPITVDVSKYVPPFLMSQVGDIGPKDLSAFAFPPAPEKLESRQYLEQLAEMRDDDILFAGTINPDDVQRSMMSIGDTVQWYANLYSEVSEAALPSEPETAGGEIGEGLGVNEVLYALMSDNDKLSELTKLVGRLRYGIDSREAGIASEAEADIRTLAAHFPEDHRIEKLIESAKSGDETGAKLADLYLQRCFSLIHEDYVKLGEVESKIATLESGN